MFFYSRVIIFAILMFFSYMAYAKELTKEIANEIVKSIEEEVGKVRFNQDLVYNLQSTVNEKINKIDNCNDNCKKELDKIKNLNNRLLDFSYSDYLIKNENIFRVLSSRVDDILKIQLKNREDISNFYRSYEPLVNKILKSNRYGISLGLDQNYLPDFQVSDNHRVEISEFQKDFGEGSRNSLPGTRYDTSFSNESYLAPTLLLTTPYFLVKFSAPSLKIKRNQSLDVVRYPGDFDGDDFLYKTSVVTTLSAIYDVSASVIISHKNKSRENRTAFDSIFEQVSFGFGFGLLGVSIENSFISDLKSRSKDEQDKVYAELDTKRLISSNTTNKFAIPYLEYFYRLQINDQFSTDVATRYYRLRKCRSDFECNRSKTNFIDVKGLTFSIRLFYMIL